MSLRGEKNGLRKGGARIRALRQTAGLTQLQLAERIGDAEIRCCGRPLTALVPQKADEAHALRLESAEDEWFVSTEHPMAREHFISFVALTSGGKLKLYRAWPEWNLQLRLLKKHGLLLWHCARDGLFYRAI